MSRPRPADAVNLIMSLFSQEESLINDALGILSECYGEADYISPFLRFDYTDYYAEETGAKLVRRFVSFAGLIRPESLADIKLVTNTLEDRFSVAGKRRLNIDPGYIAHAHLILATGKGYTHRPYLRDGIYADLTLIYQDGAFRVLPWTYPDYGSPDVIDMLDTIRRRYSEKLKLQRNLKS
ncbi:MAG: hypothetical protein CSYNP_02164 [Syntrophus sp. SKADARSKE-3]|nr:hypothetical protein [Syntrophus sp. SKADARSKE-3]